MKINILRGILILLLILNFNIIFSFSNQDGEESGGVSRKITEIVTANIKSIQEKQGIEKEKVLSRIESIIRKIAHFSIYTTLGMILMSLFSTYKMKETIRTFTSLSIGIIYAISDEIHQSFIPGRAAQITDVMIDSMGVMFGILLVILAMKIYSLNVEKA